MNEILDCGHMPSEHSELTTGYGYDKDNKTFCYACCAENDQKNMDELGKYMLYLVKQDNVYHVTNWPGSLDYQVISIRSSWHNFAGQDGRKDVWFKDHNGKTWHGVQIGHWNDVCHVKRIKAS
jgi:hypothetical protein